MHFCRFILRYNSHLKNVSFPCDFGLPNETELSSDLSGIDFLLLWFKFRVVGSAVHFRLVQFLGLLKMEKYRIM